MKTAIFFDWDGTLVDSLGLLFDAHNHARGAMGYPLWTKAEYQEAMSRSTRELYPVLYGEDKAPAAIETLYTFIKKHHLDYLKLMPGAEELLDMILTLKLPMAVVSNKRDDVLRAEVEALGWQKYFGYYMGAGVAIKDKPSAAPIFHAIAEHDMKPSLQDMIYVGDTETDLKAAREAGCDAALIQHDGKRPDLVEAYQPAVVVDNLHEFKESLIKYLHR